MSPRILMKIPTITRKQTNTWQYWDKIIKKKSRLPKILAETQLSASLMKVTRKAHSWTTCLTLHAQNYSQADGHRKYRWGRDERSDSLTLQYVTLV